MAARRAMIEPDHPEIPITRQCALLNLSRSAYYYAPIQPGIPEQACMRALDEIFTRHPYYGSRRLADELQENGYAVGRDHVRTLMHRMGLAAIYPKKHLSQPGFEHKVYPYLLRDLAIERPDQVWCADITYIRLRRGFAYLMSVMDWHSRYVLSWELSMSLESGFCVSALQNALNISRPEIFNTDQGCQFTSEAFTGVLKDAGIRISMDGRGRAFDNIMIERLWRTAKYEEVFLRDYPHFFAARESLGDYLRFYNEERRHTGLDKRTPSSDYWEGRTHLKRVG